jgi:hypothetical protein
MFSWRPPLTATVIPVPLAQPYRRLIRPFGPGRYESDHLGATPSDSHVVDPRYSPDRIDFVRAYRLLEDDLIEIFDYVEPVDANKLAYSHRIYQLLLRACTEFEANAKAVLRANGYSKSSNFNIIDYHKLEAACRLSEYGVMTPVWSGARRVFEPFKAWQSSGAYTPLGWYQAYNDTKHNRTSSFPAANFGNVLDAVAGVFIVLFAQYNILAFDPYRTVTMIQNDDNGFLSHSTPLFHIRLPNGWTDAEKYGFDWKQLKAQTDPFQSYPF